MSDRDTNRIDRPSQEEIRMSTMSRTAKKKTGRSASDKRAGSGSGAGRRTKKEKAGFGDTLEKMKQRRKENAARRAAE